MPCSCLVAQPTRSTTGALPGGQTQTPHLYVLLQWGYKPANTCTPTSAVWNNAFMHYIPYSTCRGELTITYYSIKMWHVTEIIIIIIYYYTGAITTVTHVQF